jgi:excisionase family DNA binding protein
MRLLLLMLQTIRLTTAREGGGLVPLLLDVEQIRELTGLGRDVIYQLISSGELRAVRPGSRKLFVPRSEVEAWISRQLDGGSPR